MSLDPFLERVSILNASGDQGLLDLLGLQACGALLQNHTSVDNFFFFLLQPSCRDYMLFQVEIIVLFFFTTGLWLDLEFHSAFLVQMLLLY